GPFASQVPDDPERLGLDGDDGAPDRGAPCDGAPFARVHPQPRLQPHVGLRARRHADRRLHQGDGLDNPLGNGAGIGGVFAVRHEPRLIEQRHHDAAPDAAFTWVVSLPQRVTLWRGGLQLEGVALAHRVPDSIVVAAGHLLTKLLVTADAWRRARLVG